MLFFYYGLHTPFTLVQNTNKRCCLIPFGITQHTTTLHHFITNGFTYFKLTKLPLYMILEFSDALGFCTQ